MIPFNIEDIFLKVKNIPQKYVNITVNNVTFLFVNSIFPLSNQMHVYDVEGIFKSLESKKKNLQRDLQYLEKKNKFPLNIMISYYLI